MLFIGKFPIIISASVAVLGIVNAQSNPIGIGTGTGTSGTSVATSATAPGTSNLSPCVLQCARQAATNAGCMDAIDTECICASNTFQSDAALCIQNACPASDLPQAATLATQACTAASGRTSGSASSVTSTTARSAYSSTSRNVASTGATTATRATFSGSIQQTTSSASGGVSATNSPSNLAAAAGSEVTTQMSGVLSVAVALMGIALGAFAV